jgi:hypothetical protein
MDTWLLVVRSPGGLVLRGPGESTAMSHGPGVGGPSLPQPTPATLAAALAAEAYRRGLCKPTGCEENGDPFHNTRTCLQALAGPQARLYTGLAVDTGTGELLVYTRHGFLPPEEAPAPLEATAPRDARKPPTATLTGVALQPAKKTVRQGLLYTYQLVHPEAAGIRYAALLVGRQPPAPLIARIGGKNRTAVIESRIADPPARILLRGGESGCNQWVLTLASPALLDESPWRPGNPITLDAEAAHRLLQLLLEKAGHRANAATLEAIEVPKTPTSLAAYPPGWCAAENRPPPPPPDPSRHSHNHKDRQGDGPSNSREGPRTPHRPRLGHNNTPLHNVKHAKHRLDYSQRLLGLVFTAPPPSPLQHPLEQPPEDDTSDPNRVITLLTLLYRD